VSALHRTGGRHLVLARSTPRMSAGLTTPSDDARRDPPPSTITARQLAVAALVVRGLSNPEVARVLAISINTVKKHVRDLFERCEVTSRAELAARLVASGLVEL
jgi:DNA-binding NarL/FixJ family response regulator